MTAAPRIVSHVAERWPLVDSTGQHPIIRQAVVRMCSRQSLATASGAAKKEAEVTEYFVMQKRIYMGEEEDWKIWGTLQNETSLDEWEHAINPGPQ